jgi:pimeloyl-ACP methyl ester carboxylesterase
MSQGAAAAAIAATTGPRSTATTSGEITVILLPGMHGTAELFERFEACCPPGFLTHAIGYPTDSTASVAELVELVRPRLPSSRWLLLAESFSGLVAIRLAAEKPAGLLGLVLVASAARWSRLRRLRSAPMRALFSLPAPSALLEWLFLDDATAELLPAVRRAITASPPRVLAARFRELVNADVRSELGAVEVPVLYLQASRDRLARRAELRSVTSSHQTVEVRVVDAPHFLLQTCPEAAWGHVEAFARTTMPG